MTSQPSDPDQKLFDAHQRAEKIEATLSKISNPSLRETARMYSPLPTSDERESPSHLNAIENLFLKKLSLSGLYSPNDAKLDPTKVVIKSTLENIEVIIASEFHVNDKTIQVMETLAESFSKAGKDISHRSSYPSGGTCRDEVTIRGETMEDIRQSFNELMKEAKKQVGNSVPLDLCLLKRSEISPSARYMA